jgi:hypothetical protein
MGASRDNLLQQQIDISGSTNQSQNLILSEEPDGYGARITGQIGSAASITSILGNQVTLTGLTGMTADSAGHFLNVGGAASAANNGIFEIITFISPSSVVIINAAGVAPDGYNGSLTWIERNSYMLEDDINYIRTDRKLIKGTTNWYDIPPPYTRPTNTGASVPINLTNISGKTTDATGVVTNRLFFNIPVSVGNTKVTITSAGNLKHADSVDFTGVPVFDSAPFTGNHIACFVKILDGYTDGFLTVQSGPNAGEVIYGLTQAGASTSPNSVEIAFYSVPHGANRITNSTPYTWESGLTDKITAMYGYFVRLDQVASESWRIILDPFTSTSGGGLTPNQHKALRHLIHFINEGPADGFATGAYKEILPFGHPFPTSVIWWESAAKTEKIVEKTYTYNPNRTPSTIQWKMYDTDGVSIVATVTDAITYQGVFETTRTRSIF